MVLPLRAGKPSAGSVDQVWRRKRPPWTHSPREVSLVLAPRGRPALGLIVIVPSQSPAYWPNGASSGTSAAGPAGSAGDPRSVGTPAGPRGRAAARRNAAIRVVMGSDLPGRRRSGRRAAHPCPAAAPTTPPHCPPCCTPRRRSLPGAEQAADDDELADVVGVVVGQEQHFAQEGLPLAVRDAGEQV